MGDSAFQQPKSSRAVRRPCVHVGRWRGDERARASKARARRGSSVGQNDSARMRKESCRIRREAPNDCRSQV